MSKELARAGKVAGSFVALLLGVCAGIAVWVLLNGANPLAG